MERQSKIKINYIKLRKIAIRIASIILDENAIFNIKKKLYLRGLVNMKISIPKELEIISSLVNKGDIVIDIGANFGKITYYLSKLVGSEGKVVAFEPIPQSLKILKYIAKNTGKNNVFVYNFALSDTNDEIHMSVPIDKNGNAIFGLAHFGDKCNNKSTKYRIQAKRLDDLNLKFDKIDFIKCDVEGSELNVFKGAAKTLKKYRPLIFTEIEDRHLARYDLTSNDIFAFLYGIGYFSFFFTGEVLQRCNSTVNNINNYLFVHKDRKTDLPNRHLTLKEK